MQLKAQKFRNPGPGARTVLPSAGQTRSPSHQAPQGYPGRILISTVPAPHSALGQLSCPASRAQLFWKLFPTPEAPALLELPRSLLAALALQRSQGSHKVEGVDFCADLGKFYPSCRAFGVKLLTQTGNMTTMCFPPQEKLRAALRCINCSCRWWLWHSTPDCW